MRALFRCVLVGKQMQRYYLAAKENAAQDYADKGRLSKLRLRALSCCIAPVVFAEK
jgi:hypothetical protein